jgi:tetratricopeptide (TPR) repeat protein
MRRAIIPVCLLLGAGCHRAAPAAPAAQPSILLVTLDTTRADAIGPEAKLIDTPAFNGIAARGRRFRQAYAAAPETLPSHTSIMTGLYPAGHGVHENGRALPAAGVAAAERLKAAGYSTAAFVSSFVLARQFGLSQGFDTYDDAVGLERSAKDTTARATAFLEQARGGPVFVWVHYFDPHAPYAPPDAQRVRFKDKPYLGEVAAMDEQLGHLVAAFDRHAAGSHHPAAIIVAADHGEGLGDHGELTHGNLLYQSTMHVPLVIAGPGVEPGVVETPVSTRRIFHTLLDWAGLDANLTLRASAGSEVVLGEAMKPYLEYGWQPQIMAVAGRDKAILAGRTDVFDVIADPGETKAAGAGGAVPPALRKSLDDYPVPVPGAAKAPEGLSAEAQQNLASLGYVSASVRPPVRRDAPRPVDMAPLFPLIEQASTFFVREQYAEAIPLFEAILAKDPFNLDAALRIATAESMLGRNARAVAAFRKAAAIAPESPDVQVYLALHYARTAEWPRAVPILERIIAETPDRVAAVEALASIRERQGRLPDAIALRQRVQALSPPSAPALVHLGELAMAAGQTPVAIQSFEQARAMQGRAFAGDLELGVLYLAARRLDEARQALDRVPASHPEYPMALFKRAQVSVLLNEPDRAARIALARRHADATTRPLIANERLFK